MFVFTQLETALFSVTMHSFKEHDSGTLIVSRAFYVFFTFYHICLPAWNIRDKVLPWVKWLWFLYSLCYHVALGRYFVGYLTAALAGICFASLLPQQVKITAVGHLSYSKEDWLQWEVSLTETWKSHSLPDLPFHEEISKTLITLINSVPAVLFALSTLWCMFSQRLTCCVLSKFSQDHLGLSMIDVVSICLAVWHLRRRITPVIIPEKQ